MSFPIFEGNFAIFFHTFVTTNKRASIILLLYVKIMYMNSCACSSLWGQLIFSKIVLTLNKNFLNISKTLFHCMPRDYCYYFFNGWGRSLLVLHIHFNFFKPRISNFYIACAKKTNIQGS